MSAFSRLYPVQCKFCSVDLFLGTTLTSSRTSPCSRRTSEYSIHSVMLLCCFCAVCLHFMSCATLDSYSYEAGGRKGCSPHRVGQTHHFFRASTKFFHNPAAKNDKIVSLLNEKAEFVPSSEIQYQNLDILLIILGWVSWA